MHTISDSDDYIEVINFDFHRACRIIDYMCKFCTHGRGVDFSIGNSITDMTPYDGSIFAKQLRHLSQGRSQSRTSKITLPIGVTIADFAQVTPISNSQHSTRRSSCCCDARLCQRQLALRRQPGSDWRKPPERLQHFAPCDVLTSHPAMSQLRTLRSFRFAPCEVCEALVGSSPSAYGFRLGAWARSDVRWDDSAISIPYTKERAVTPRSLAIVRRTSSVE